MSAMKVMPAALTVAPGTNLKPARLSTATKSRVLVIAPNWVGDAIVSLALVDALANQYDAVDVLATPAVAAVYECAGTVSRVIVENLQHGQLQLRLRQEIAARLRGHYGLAVICPNSLKSALIPFLAEIPRRRGFTGEFRYGLLNERRPPPSAPAGRRPSMLHQYLALADDPPLPERIDGFGAHQPRLNSPAQPRVDTAGALILCPGAEYGPAKQWPLEHFARVALAWLDTSIEHRVIIVGGPRDFAAGETILNYVSATTPTQKNSNPRIENLCGKTTLMEAFAIIAHAPQVISNDSGLMHAAAALGVPVIALFGSTDPHHTPPHSQKAVVLSLNLKCSPCFKRVCPLGTTACLKDLPSERVIERLNLPAETITSHN